MDELTIAGRSFRSCLFIGTGNLPPAAIEAGGTELVAVRLRRLDLDSPHDEFVESIDGKMVRRP